MHQVTTAAGIILKGTIGKPLAVQSIKFSSSLDRPALDSHTSDIHHFEPLESLRPCTAVGSFHPTFLIAFVCPIWP